MTSTLVLVRDLVATAVAFGLSLAFIYYSRTPARPVRRVGPFLLTGVSFLIGIPVYLAQRRHMTQPEPVPAYR